MQRRKRNRSGEAIPAQNQSQTTKPDNLFNEIRSKIAPNSQNSNFSPQTIYNVLEVGYVEKKPHYMKRDKSKIATFGTEREALIYALLKWNRFGPDAFGDDIFETIEFPKLLTYTNEEMKDFISTFDDNLEYSSEEEGTYYEVEEETLKLSDVDEIVKEYMERLQQEEVSNKKRRLDDTE